MFNIKKNFI